MSIALWLSVAAVCALGAMSPGPSLAVVIRNTIGGGRGHGLVTAWGHAAGIGVYALMTAFGMAIAIEQSPLLHNALTIAGAAYLLYLGTMALRSSAQVGDGDVAAHPDFGRVAREGFLTALLNPKVAVFFLAIFSQFLQPGMSTWAHLVMAITAVLVDGLWYSVVSLLLTRGAWHELLRRQARNIDRVAGGVLVLLAVAGIARLIYG